MSLLWDVLYAAHARSTHHKLALDSLHHLAHPLRDAWQSQFLTYYSRYLAGAKDPDDRFKDFKNHVLHVRQGLWGGAIPTARRWYSQALEELRRRNWSDAVYAAGVLSHYFMDPVQPFHTHQSEAETVIHRAFEWSTTKSYEQLRNLLDQRFGYPVIELSDREDWLEDLIERGARLSNKFYEPLIDHYDFYRGSRNPPEGLDDFCRVSLSRLIGWAIIGYARVLDRLFEEADVVPPPGDLTLAAFMATLEMPIQWIAAKITDVRDRQQILSMYAEFQATGRVDQTLTQENRTIRDLVIARDAKKSPQVTIPAPIPVAAVTAPSAKTNPVVTAPVVETPVISAPRAALPPEPILKTPVISEPVVPNTQSVSPLKHVDEIFSPTNEVESAPVELLAPAPLNTGPFETEPVSVEPPVFTSIKFTLPEIPPLAVNETKPVVPDLVLPAISLLKHQQPEPEIQKKLEHTVDLQTDSLPQPVPEQEPAPLQPIDSEPLADIDFPHPDAPPEISDEADRRDQKAIGEELEEEEEFESDLEQPLSSPNEKQLLRRDDDHPVPAPLSLRYYLELDSEIVDAPSIGPKTAKRLKGCRIRKVQDLLQADLSELAGQLKTPHITEQILRDWQDQARLVCGVPDLRGHDAQLLVACGVRSVRALAEFNVDPLTQRVVRFCKSPAGQRILRNMASPDSEEVAEWIANAQQGRGLQAA